MSETHYMREWIIMNGCDSMKWMIVSEWLKVNQWKGLNTNEWIWLMNMSEGLQV